MQYVLGLVLIVVLIAGLFVLVNRPERVAIEAEIPADFPADGFSHAVFENLLRQYVDANGEVDYAVWVETPSAVTELESYLAAVAEFSPEKTPARFPDRSAELAYWLYAYNAYVIRTIIYEWPIDSVTDVKAPLEAVKGLGFFYRLRFDFGGSYYSLLHVENRIIRKKFQDPRIHFVLNCGSESCPPLRPELPEGEQLEELLQVATTDFVADPRNVFVDHENKRVVVSTIFKWFRKDFVNDLKRRGVPSQHGVIDYIANVAPPNVQAELNYAAEYELVFEDFDWALNSADKQ